MSPGEPRRSAAEIEAGIARTRAALGRTADALAQQLDTRHLFTKGLDMIAESVAGNGEFRLGEAIRANSVPLALIGLGVGWLLAGHIGVIDAVAQDRRVDAARRRISNVAADRAGETVGVTGNPQIDDPTGERSGNGWVHQAADAARGAVRTVREAGDAVIERAGDYAGEAAHVPERVSRTFARYPLLVGVLGIAAGAALAALLPPTRVEDEWLGKTRDNLRDGARALAREAVDRVRNIAEDAPR